MPQGCPRHRTSNAQILRKVAIFSIFSKIFDSQVYLGDVLIEEIIHFELLSPCAVSANFPIDNINLIESGKKGTRNPQTFTSPN